MTAIKSSGIANKKIFLTFDDGPNEPYTSEILNILAAHGAKATFFVCGKNIEKNPGSLRRIAAAGHAIGTHSYSHNLGKVLKGDLMEEIELTRELIRRDAGVDTLLYRSPWGITRPKLKRRLLEQGYRVFHWDIMAFDWRRPEPGRMAAHIIGRAFPGAVVLLHDGDQVKGGHRSNTVEALKMIVPALASRGYEFAALEQNHARKAAPLKNIFVDNITWLFNR